MRLFQHQDKVGHHYLQVAMFLRCFSCIRIRESCYRLLVVKIRPWGLWTWQGVWRCWPLWATSPRSTRASQALENSIEFDRSGFRGGGRFWGGVGAEVIGKPQMWRAARPQESAVQAEILHLHKPTSAPDTDGYGSKHNHQGWTA